MIRRGSPSAFCQPEPIGPLPRGNSSSRRIYTSSQRCTRSACPWRTIASVAIGDPGDAYYAIAAGELDARQDGHFLRRCGRGEGVGEIALLRAIPRTATVVAHTAATVCRPDRDPFLTAVLGHAPTQRRADRIAETRLAADAAPGTSDTQGTGAAEPG